MANSFQNMAFGKGNSLASSFIDSFSFSEHLTTIKPVDNKAKSNGSSSTYLNCYYFLFKYIATRKV